MLNLFQGYRAEVLTLMYSRTRRNRETITFLSGGLKFR